MFVFFKRMVMLLNLSWYYLRMMPQFVWGVWKIARLPQPVITIFGGSHLQMSSEYAHWAQELSRRLVSHEISILTGGGPGIMEAANCGAFRKDHHDVHTMGISVRGLPGEEQINPCVSDYIIVDEFAIRRYLLINYSCAFVVFPGGLGTLNELAEVMTLMQTNKLPIMPVILMGEQFWKPLLSWIESSAAQNLILPLYKSYFMITDDINKVEAKLLEHCKKMGIK